MVFEGSASGGPAAAARVTEMKRAAATCVPLLTYSRRRIRPGQLEALKSKITQVDELHIRICKWWICYLEQAAPRTLCFWAPPTAPVTIFTDGWQSELSADRKLGAGGVLYDPVDGTFEYFGFMIRQSLVDAWAGPSHKRMLINQAELLPVLVSRLTWAARLQDRRVIHWIDNDGVKDSLVNGYSRVSDSGDLLGIISLADIRLRLACWFDRVASPSNLADGPSREDYAEVESLGAVWTRPVIPYHRVGTETFSYYTGV